MTVVLIAGGSAATESLKSLPALVSDENTFQVERSLLLVPCEVKPLRRTVEVVGEIECVDKSTVESECTWATPILEIVEQGTFVKKGDVVMRLDASTLETRAKQERIDVVEAQADLDKARERLSIQQLTNESRISARELALKLAVLDLESYREGDLPRLRSALAGSVELARESVVRAQENFDYKSRLVLKGYESAVSVDKERIQLQKAQNQFARATDKLDLLVEHTQRRELIELEARVDRFRSELERAKSEAAIALQSREFDVVYRTQRLKSQQDYLERLEEGIAACTICAPRSGRVVIAKPRTSRSSSATLQPGSVVYRRQALFDIPRFDQLNVEVKVHETLVRYLEPGQQVEIRVDARPDMVYHGQVQSVSSVPTSGSYPNYDLRVYPAVISIEESPEVIADLRPGLTAHSTIVADERDECRTIPSQSVVNINGQPSVFVAVEDDAETIELRPVEVGLSTDSRVEILNGVDVADQLVLSPKTELSELLISLFK